MKRPLTFLIIALFAGVSVAGVKNVAVVETEIDAQSGVSAQMTSADARLVTTELRREAVKNLPRDKYNIMTTETVYAQGGAVLEECADENCVITLGSKIGADYIVRGTISRVQTMFTLSVEIYETEDGNLVASSDPVRAETVLELLDKAAVACANMYRTFANTQRQTSPTPIIPAPKSEPVKTAAEPKPIAKKSAEVEPAPSSPKYSGTVSVPGDAKTISESGNEDVGMPGWHFITDRGRSQYLGVTNPAFVNEENDMSLRFLYASTMDVFYTIEAGFIMPLGIYDAVGVSWNMQGTSKYEATKDDGTPTGQNISDQGHFIALTYANNVWKGLTVGGNLNIIAQNVYEVDNSSPNNEVINSMRFGFGVDIGLTYKLLRHQLLGNHILGLSTNNLVNMIMDTDEKYVAALRFSLLSDFWKRRVYYGADLVLKDFLANEGDWSPDATKEMPWELTQKLGINIRRIFKLYGLVGFNNEGVDHYGFAIGAKMGFHNFRSIEAMMQFVSIANPGSGESEANASHITFYARTEFGKHREESYIRK